MTRLSLLFAVFMVFFSVGRCPAQVNSSAANEVIPDTDAYLSKVDRKLSSMNDRLKRKSLQYLARFKKHEEKLWKKLNRAGSSTAISGNIERQYDALAIQIRDAATAGDTEYIPYLDTLSASLSFLKEFNNEDCKISKSLSDVSNLQTRLQQSEKIKAFIGQRRQYIKDQLSTYAKLPPGLKKEFARLHKTASYYSLQMNEYKEMLKDPAKAERKALTLLSKLPAFQRFLCRNSQLASIFRLDADPSPGDLAFVPAGLQTRASVRSLLQPQVSANGQSARQIIDQNIAQAKSDLNKLKEDILKSSAASVGEMPNFKPNMQKTKTFLKRLEYGANVQFTKGSNIFPSAANVGASLGYKLNDKSIIGTGISYKIGTGSIRHLVISHQGIGLRSFADHKIKGSFFMSAGFEMNYNAAFKKMEELKNYNAWQSSGLIGLSKRYNIPSPFGKRRKAGEMKLLYDFLAHRHIPASQRVVFRLGYKF